ncbi:MAG: ribonuclease P protein component [Prevotella sp.]|nr:ribonuclease P protein component [Prevotella sp.]
MTDYSFKKCERIVSQKEIDLLFSDKGSHSLVAFPVRAVYRITSNIKPQTSNIKLLLSVPKKRFKHAVDRNRVKRQLREAYRHHRHLLTDSMAEGLSLSIAFIWLTDAHFPSETVDHRVSSLLRRIAAKLH